MRGPVSVAECVVASNNREAGRDGRRIMTSVSAVELVQMVWMGVVLLDF